MTFDELGLAAPLLRAVGDTGYTTPTPIQARAIPAILGGADVMGAAQTGTGKTAGFTLPLLQRLDGGTPARSNRARALVLTPTRELAAQIEDSVTTYGKYLKLRSTVVFGGVPINPQMMRLRKGVDVLVATPGRLLDLHAQRAISFEDLEVLVLDEADRMLDMGFIHDIRKVIALLPRKRQNLMFSATFSDDIRKLAKTITNDPVEIDVAPRNSTVELIEQIVHPVDKSRKVELLSHLIRTGNWFQVLVFSRTKHGADKLVRRLGRDNIDAAAIHGNKSQSQRTKALGAFKQNKVQILVATDIAARGIDIDQLSHVVNFDLPNVPEDYVHRIGRTGRAGAGGNAISLVCADESKQLRDIERLVKRELPRSVVPGFEPEHVLPASVPAAKPQRPQRGNKPSGNGRRRGGEESRRGAPRSGNRNGPGRAGGAKTVSRKRAG